MIDRAQLKAAIAADTQTIKEMKERRSESGHPRWGGLDEWALVKAKFQATIHHSIAAHLRKKLHIKKVWSELDQTFYPRTLEDQANLIAPYLKKFERPSGETADTAASNTAASA